MPGGFAEALTQAFSIEGLLLLTLGMIAGAVSGLVPGMGGLTGMVLFLPFTLTMSPGGALMFFGGIAGAPRFTGAITSIVLNIPGSPVNAATMFDGYPMARAGQARRALAIASMASILGTLFGLGVLLALMPIMFVILRIVGPQELFSLAILALATIAFSSTTNLRGFVKGLASGGVGLMIAFMGVATVTGLPRFNFGSENYLYGGIRLVPLFIGLFAVGQVIKFAAEESDMIAEHAPPGAHRGVAEGVRDCFRHWRTLMRGSTIGAALGVLPGVGGVAANFLSYSWTKAASPNPERFGTGLPEAVVATESADNAEGVSHLIPTLSFGVPGSAEGAVILGLLTLQGFVTGPLLLRRHPDILWLLVIATTLSVLIVSSLGLASTGILARMTALPLRYLAPMILVASLFGTYVAEFNFWDVGLALLVGLFGYFFVRFDFSPAALVIGYVLGGLTEDSFVLGYQTTGGRYFSFFTRPLSIAIWSLIAIMTFFAWRTVRKRRTARLAAETERGADRRAIDELVHDMEKATAGDGAPPTLPGIAFALLLAGFVALLVVLGQGYAFRARLVPTVIGVPTVVLLLIGAGLEVWRRKTLLDDVDRDRPLSARARATLTSMATRRLFLVVAWMLLYLLAIYVIGFAWASTFAVLVYVFGDYVMGDGKESSLRRTAVVTGVLMIAVYVVLSSVGEFGLPTFEGVIFGDRPPPF